MINLIKTQCMSKRSKKRISNEQYVGRNGFRFIVTEETDKANPYYKNFIANEILIMKPYGY